MKIKIESSHHSYTGPHRTVFDPAFPAAVITGLQNLVGETIVSVIVINPQFEDWQDAVRRNQTKLGFKEWCEEQLK